MMKIQCILGFIGRSPGGSYILQGLGGGIDDRAQSWIFFRVLTKEYRVRVGEGGGGEGVEMGDGFGVAEEAVG